MNNNLNQNVQQEVRENVIAGIVGAFLFSLAGGVLWFVIYLLGFIAGISGLVGAICAIKGYSVFAKKESIKGIIISVVMSLVVIVIAWYLCLAYDVFVEFKNLYAIGEIDYTLTYFESVQAARLFLQDPEVSSAYLGNLGMGLLFCVIGGGSYVVNKIKSVKNKANVPASEPAANDGSAEPSETAEEKTEAEDKTEE